MGFFLKFVFASLLSLLTSQPIPIVIWHGIGELLHYFIEKIKPYKSTRVNIVVGVSLE